MGIDTTETGMIVHENIIGLKLRTLCLIASKYEPDISAVLAEYNEEFEIDTSYESLYATLENLNQSGLVKKRPVDGRTNCYMLTRKGAKVLRSHRRMVIERTDDLNRRL